MVESWVERLYASTPRHRLEALDITAPLETKASPRRRSKSRRRTKSVELMQGNLIEYAKRQHRRSKLPMRQIRLFVRALVKVDSRLQKCSQLAAL